MDRGRLEAFSDGVFAVAITLLVIGLAVPEPGRGALGQQLASHWPSFAAYVVSFLAIGIIWVNHHNLVRNFAHVDRAMLFLNLLMLFFVVTIPFATATMAAYLREGGADASLAAVIYQVVFLGMSLAFGTLFWWSIRHKHLAVPLTGAAARTALIRFTIGNLAYAAAVGVAYLSAPASLLMSGLVGVYYVFEQTPPPAGARAESRGTRSRETATSTGRRMVYPGVVPQAHQAPGAILDDVLSTVGDAPVGAGPAGDEVTLRGSDPVFPTPPRVGELGAAAIAAAALAAARVHTQRTGIEQQVTVDVDAAAAAMRSWTYLADVAAPPRAPSGGQQFFATEDDQWIFLHRRAAHHAARQDRVLGCGHSDAEVAEAVRRWKGAELEEAIVAADACAALVRTHDEWARLKQAAAVAELPLLEVTKIGDSGPEPAGAGDRPLGGLRVLDVTHVLAGPTCARTLAEHGSDVLRIGMSASGDRNPMQRDTGHGKRSAVLELKSADGASGLRTLIGGADVFSQGYRPGALAALGFSPADAARLRPGIVYVSVTAFGRLGPWRGRRGYDSVVQSVSGFCDEVAVDGEPRFLPVSALDYVTGYLAAFGVLTALARRAEGGSYHVQLSLAQTGRYLAGLPRTSAAERAGRSPELPAGRLAELLTETDTPFGRLRHLAPAARMSATPPRWDRPTVPMNHDSPSWELTRR